MNHMNYWHPEKLNYRKSNKPQDNIPTFAFPQQKFSTYTGTHDRKLKRIKHTAKSLA